MEKKIRVLLLVLILAVIGVLSYQQEKTEGDVAVIQAGTGSNDQAEGTEIWINGVSIDGQWFDAERLHDGNWIVDDGKVGWIEYNQPRKLDQQIQITIPYGKERSIEFESNKWRGYVKICYAETEETIDLYSPNESGEFMYELPEHRNGISKENDRRILWVLTGGALVILLLSLKKKNKESGRKRTDLKERETWADFLRIICTYIVVLLHATCEGFVSAFGTKTWIAYLMINCFTACAVPIFFMLSGALTIQKEEIDFRKAWYRFMKISGPLIVWSIVYIFVRKIVLKEEINVFVQILRIPTESQYYHLWFIYTICGLYLLNPVISFLYYCQNKKLQQYIAVVFGLIPMILATIARLTNYKVDISFLYLFFPMVFIYVIGKVIVDHKEYIIKKRRVWPILFMIGIGMVVLLTYTGSVYIQSPAKRFFSDADHIPMLLMFVPVFCMFVSFSAEFKKLPEQMKVFFANWSDVCVQIYFMHMLIYILIGEQRIGSWLQLSYHSSNFIQNIITSIVCFALSSAIAGLMRIFRR